MKYGRYLLFLILAGLAVTLVSCKPRVAIYKPAGVLAQRMAEPAPQKMTPHLVRPESDRRFREHSSGWVKSHVSQAKSNPGQCLVCHTSQSCTTCHEGKLPKSHDSAAWVTSHKKSGDNCDECHTEDYCTACHGMEMPHPKDWKKVHVPAANQNKAQCLTCHTESYCDECHAKNKPADHTKDWTFAHGSSSNDKTCLKCHQQSYCDKCHATTKPRSHSVTWAKGHGDIVVDEKPDCTTCHSEKYCNNCHGGVEMPHQTGFIMTHKQHGASLAEGSACYKCHEQKYCQLCHPGK